jgi:hypothetical protein
MAVKDVHLVVGDATESATAVGELEPVGIACATADPEQMVRIEPLGPCALDGWRAEFRNRAAERFKGIILLASPWQLPWLDPGLLDWESGRPRLVAGLLAPGLANLYVVNLGVGGLRAGGLDLLRSLIRRQAGVDHPLVDELMSFVAPSHEAPVGRAIRRLERRMERWLRPGGAVPWWAAAHELDGPLNAPRGT